MSLTSTMSVQLYNNTSDPRVVHKTKSLVTTLTGELKESVNLQNVVVTVPMFENFASVNYAYIERFRRYYYVTVEYMTADRLKLIMRSDPLSSFWSSYCKSQVIARRSSSAPDIRIPDERILKLPEPRIIVRKTTLALTPSSSNNYVLTLTGK